MKIIIDAKDLVTGRLAAYVAKQALLGDEIIIVNSDQAIISGTRTSILAKFKTLRAMGKTTRGPYFPRQSHAILKRIIMA